jgi:NlpC/P60 family protein
MMKRIMMYIHVFSHIFFRIKVPMMFGKIVYTRENGGAYALKYARRLTGLPYKFGGTAPGPTDCSGMFQWAYRMVGVFLSRTTYMQYDEYRLNDNVPYEEGDGIFIPGSDAEGDLPGHVMMYVSEGQVFQAEETGTLIGQFPYDTSVYQYRSRPALGLRPAGKPKTKNPTPEQLSMVNFVLLPTPGDARTALNNGWGVFVWKGHWFGKPKGRLAKGTPEYANANYMTPKT